MTIAWIDQKRRYRRYQARIEVLPGDHRDAVAAMERYVNHLGGMDDAEAMLGMLDDLADLFEQAAADGTRVREIFGADPVEFAQSFLDNYPSARWITREQDRLSAEIDRIDPA